MLNEISNILTNGAEQFENAKVIFQNKTQGIVI